MIKSEYQLTGNSEITRTAVSGELSGVSRARVGDIGDLVPEHAWWKAHALGQPLQLNTQGKLRYVDLFSSVGGLSLGAKHAAEAVSLTAVAEAAIDIDSAALDVHKHNLGTQRTKVGSVSDIVDYLVYGEGHSASNAYEPEIIDPEIGDLVGNLDLVLAGPPCQGHSNLNNHTRRSDPRNQLYISATAAAIALRPSIVVFENVPDIERDRSNVVETSEALFKEASYHVSRFSLVASELGAPQSRRRHFLVATTAPHVDEKTLKKCLAGEPMSLRSVIGDLTEVSTGDFMLEVPQLSDENIQRIAYLFDNDEYQLPNAWRPDCHKDGHTYPSVYGRLSWDKPSPTITTGFMTPGRGRYIHPAERRVITPREAARIQGFPDTFSFAPEGIPPSRKNLSKWIGDAVPVQLGYAAVLAALSALPKPIGYGE